MANTQAVPTFDGYRTTAMAALYPTSGVKAALFLATATINGTTAAYTTTGEVTGTGYTAGGVAVTTTQAPQITTNTTYWTPAADISFGTVTLGTAFDCFMLYDTGATNRNIFVGTFSSQTVTAAAFTITMPTDDATTGLVRWTWS